MFGKLSKHSEEKLAVQRAYCRLFDSDDGRKVLKDMCNTFHILHSSFTQDPHETAFREGERSVVLRILKTINADPFELEQMLRKREGTIE